MSQMHIEVPFFESWVTENTGGVHCIEMSLKMILGYFEPGKEYDLSALERITDKQPEKASWEMPYAIWFGSHGYELKHYSTFDYAVFKSDGIDYIRREYGDETAEYQLRTSDILGAQAMVDEYLEKATVVSKKPVIQDIVDVMQDGYIVRAAVNSNYLNGKDGYEGHSVVVTGYDDEHIWFHDPGPPGVENRKVTREIFQEAMDSFGSEIDIFKLKEA